MDVRGNVSTCRRYVAAAEEALIPIEWLYGDSEALVTKTRAVLAESPDETLLHGHHAIRTGPALLAAKRPFVVSLGGTELEFLERDPTSAGLYEEVLLKAQQVLIPNTDAQGYLAALGVSRERVSLVPRGVEVASVCPAPRHPKAVGPVRERCGIGAETPLLFLPSGLRPGKNPIGAVMITKALRKSGVDAHLAIAGMRLDAWTADAIENLARTRPWIHVLAPFPFEKMDAVYADTDIILNTSKFEGMSNALLEAQAAARPVLASNIPANLDGLAPELRQAAFGNPAAALATLKDWLADTKLRNDLGRAGYEFVRDHFSLTAEREALLRSWCRAIV